MVTEWQRRYMGLKSYMCFVSKSRVPEEATTNLRILEGHWALNKWMEISWVNHQLYLILFFCLIILLRAFPILKELHFVVLYVNTSLKIPHSITLFYIISSFMLTNTLLNQPTYYCCGQAGNVISKWWHNRHTEMLFILLYFI